MTNKYVAIATGLAVLGSVASAEAASKKASSVTFGGNTTANTAVQTFTSGASKYSTGQTGVTRSDTVSVNGANGAFGSVAAGKFVTQPASMSSGTASPLPTSVSMGGKLNNNQLEQDFTAAAQKYSSSQTMATDSTGVSVNLRNASATGVSAGNFSNYTPN